MPSCTQCSTSFELTAAEHERLQDISPSFNGQKYLIPPPSLCPRCRVQRRMAWRNDRTFYKRKCDLTGEQFISMYAPDAVFPVYKQDAWHSDKWNAMDHGRDFDFSRGFFEQWAELRDSVPHWGVAISNCENSDYCNYCTDEKNCYIDIAAEGNEDCYYNLFTKFSKNCVDCTFCYDSTLCYESIQCYNCYNLRNCQYMDNSSDCTFCYDCKGCRNCLLSTNLRSKEYYILNQPHTKEHYEQKLKELNLSAYSAVESVREVWNQKRIEKGIYRDMYTINCEDSVGNNLKNCSRCNQCFNATNCEDCSYLYDVLDAKDCMDMNYSLYNPESCYEVISTVGLTYSAFYMMGPYNSNCFYSQMCQSCSNCFGCIGLKQQEYCILNKQYTKEQYEELVPRIIEHMRNTPYSSAQTPEWGQFFPVHLSPHGYNETVAHEYMPLTQEQILSRGWHWREPSEDIGTVTRTIPAERLPDDIADIPNDILNWAVTCAESKKPFKIVKQELEFYRQQGIPVPREHNLERHHERNALRTPRSLWSNVCRKCGKGILSGYEPGRPEKVYCEACYLEEVY